MCARTARILRTMVFAFAVTTPAVFSQAIFSVSSAPSIAADIGYTELAGSITLVVYSGPTAAGPIVITYSAPITNAESDISIIGTGNLNSSYSPSLDPSTNSILFNIPAGGAAGDKLVISGVRVAVAGSNITQAKAMITTPSNMIMGDMNPIVIGTVMKPFFLDQSTVKPLSYAAGMRVDYRTTFEIGENYTNAFTSSGIGGQTGPTRIRINPFPSLPEGAQLTYSATAISSTGAVFTTLSGQDETVPRADGSTGVVYRFTAAANSSTVDEGFTFTVDLDRAPASGSGIILFQATLLPIGTATPNEQYPSADIPRYAERPIPEDDELTIGRTELFFPFRIDDDDTYTGIAITNPHNYDVKATLTAYDAKGEVIAGNNITNPREIILPENSQYVKFASEIFGAGFNQESGGMIRLVANASGLKGFYLIGDNSGPKLDGSNAETESADIWFMPIVFHQGSNPFNLLEIYNPGQSEATVTLRLMDANGSEFKVGTATVPALGLVLRDVGELFATDLSSFQGGYLKLESDVPVQFRNNFGNAMESNVLLAQLPSSAYSFSVPHFASGGQYSTSVTLVNTNVTKTSEVTFTLLDNGGTPISAAGGPVTVSIKPKAQLTRTISDLFPNLGPNLVTGSIKINVSPMYAGPFLSSPGLIGAVRFASADGSASATIPAILSPATDFVYSHVAQGLGYWTGLAVQNTNQQSAQYTIDVFSKDGALVGSYSSTLAPGERFSKLVSELVPKSAGQLGGYIRIRSDLPLGSLALFGTNDVRSMSAITAQILH